MVSIVRWKGLVNCAYIQFLKRKHSTAINMLKRQPPNEKGEMLPLYEGVYKPKRKFIDFESAREILMKED